MKRSVMILGFLLLMAIDTFVQIGFKMAGNNTLPMTLDWPWLQRVCRTLAPRRARRLWRRVPRLHDADQVCADRTSLRRLPSRDRHGDAVLGLRVRGQGHAVASARLLRHRRRRRFAGRNGRAEMTGLGEVAPTAGLAPRLRDLVTGPADEGALEAAICKLLELPDIELMSTGTAALRIAFHALKRRSPRRTTVIVPGYTCPLVVIAAHAAGLNCIACDTLPRRLRPRHRTPCRLVDETTLVRGAHAFWRAFSPTSQRSAPRCLPALPSWKMPHRRSGRAGPA